MQKLHIGGIAVAAVLAATIAGYRLGAGTWPSLGAPSFKPVNPWSAS